MQISSLSLLIKDRRYAQELSDLFKKMDVECHYYEDLEEFWFDHLSELPTLAIVDVESLSQGSMNLADHPQVKAEKLPLAFVYNDDNAPLVLACHSYLHFGFINRTLPPGGQLKSILRRINKFSEQREETLELREELSKSTEIVQRLQKKSLDLNIKQQEIDEALSSLSPFQDFVAEGKPTKAIQYLMESLSSVEKYSLIELSLQGRKLYSSEVRGKKNTLFPKIDLRRTYSEGIDKHLQAIIKQMGFDLLGHQARCKFIFNPKGECRAALLYLAPGMEKVTTSLLDLLLDRSWSSKVSFEKSIKSENLNIYDLREMMTGDLAHFRVMGFKWKALLEISRQVENSQVAWEKLEASLIGKLNEIFGFSFKIYFDSQFQIILFSQSQEGEDVFDKVMTLLRNFPVWDLVETEKPYSLSRNKVVAKRLPFSLQAIQEFLGLEPEEANSPPRKEFKSKPAALDQ